MFLAAVVGPVTGCSEGGTSARIELSADEVLIDEQVDITVVGLQPGQSVRLRLLLGGGSWQSEAFFEADDRGEVRVAETSPTRGDYAGVDPMGLFWSARPKDDRFPQAFLGPGFRRVELIAEVEGKQVASATLERRQLAEDVRSRSVREQGIAGTFFDPPGPGPHPALMVLGGSEGGVPETVAGHFANHGYAVLALAYFDPNGTLGYLDREGQAVRLPTELALIPLEYFATALEWLESQPEVDAGRVGLVGGSRGAELALILSDDHPDVRVVVAYAPSNVAWPAVPPRTEAAWTRGGQPIPTMPASYRTFPAALDDPEAVARAAIPVERINGGVLLISGGDDQLWPASMMADEIVERLRANQFPHAYRHLSYSGAGHAIVTPYQPTTTLAENRARGLVLGGNPSDAARASREHWPQLLKFLQKNLD